MSSGHIASIRSSAGSAHQRAEAVASSDLEHIDLEDSSQSDQLAKMSVMSLSDDDSGKSKPRNRSRSKQPPSSHMVTSKLVSLTDIQDIDAHFNTKDIHHANAIVQLEQRWAQISRNLDTTLNHLQEWNERVSSSSRSCLEALKSSVETTCDNVDEELKAFYHLMTKCDELTTKVSMAGSFRDEIKTLRKSVETLEQLYKTQQQTKAQNLQQQQQQHQQAAASRLPHTS